jgi:hypothetical protein
MCCPFKLVSNGETTSRCHGLFDDYMLALCWSSDNPHCDVLNTQCGADVGGKCVARCDATYARNAPVSTELLEKRCVVKRCIWTHVYHGIAKG